MKNSFLQQTVNDLIRRVGLQGLENYTLVFPMQRAGLFAKQYIAEAMRDAGETRPVVLPRFTTIDMLADSLCPLRSEDETISILRVYKAYCEHVESPMPLDIFYGWGQQLLTDFSAVDSALLNVQRMLDLTADAAALEELTIEDEVRERLERLLRTSGSENSVRAYFTALWQALPKMYRSFTEASTHDGVGSHGARYRWVCEHFDDPSVEAAIRGRHFVFVGFNYLLASERRLMTLLRDHDPEGTFFYWDYNPAFPLSNGIFDFMPDEIRRFGNALPVDDTTHQPTIQAIAFPSEAGQAQYVHDWLLQHHRPGQQTAIVLADESLLPQVIYALPEGEQFAHINITKGYALRSTRLFAEISVWLDEDALMSAQPEEAIRILSTRLESVYRTIRHDEDDRWLAVLTDESYYQIQLVLRQFVGLLRNDEVASLLTSTELPPSALLLRLIRRRLEQVSIPFHGEPISDIQIIGVLETRLLDFDNILVLSMEEGVLPRTAADRSFLPFDLRREYHMQTRDEEAKIYGYNFFRLLRRATTVSLAFSEATTEVGKKSMSRFLMQMLTSPAFSIERYLVHESDSRSQMLVGDAVFSPEDGDERPDHLSPSSINKYIECPKQFYLNSIRHIGEVEEDTVLFSSATFGTLVHATLENAYRQHQTEGKFDLQRALEAAYAEHPELIMDDHQPENNVIKAMATRVLQSDEELQDMQIVDLECKFRMQSLPLSGMIDRLDIATDQDGTTAVRVIDYKTGSFDEKKLVLKDWDELFSDSSKKYPLQVLIYCAALTEVEASFGLPDLPIRPELFFPGSQATGRTICIPGSDKNTVALTDYRAQAKEIFEPKLAEKINEILSATSFPMTDEETCFNSYCPFHELCARPQKEWNL